MKTEEELDNLFKQGLEEPGNYKNYREADWDALEAMLDEKKRRGVIYWLPLVSGIAATLILALAWQFLGTGVKNTKGPKQITQTINKQTPKELNGTEPVITKPNITPNDQVNPGKNDRLTQQQAVLTKKLRLPVNGDASHGSTNNKSFLALSAVEAGRAAGPEQDNTTIDRSAGTLAAVDTRVFGKDELNKNIAFNGFNIVPNTAPNPVQQKAKSLSGFHPQYALTVLASSNLNGVGTFGDSKVGTTGGFLFSVGLSKRFTVSTGAVYAKTPYNTEFYNYHTSYNFKVNPESVNADCRVLDIPLNIDYKFAQKGRNSFSVGSGLSTYIMLSEKYHYNYATPNPNPYWLSDVSVVNKNSHFFGVLNLDATYQRQLNSKLSVAVQPYMKLPLTDIGNGQVKLQSTGLSVGLSWNINTLKR
ncbi:hypothetical protein ACFGVR_05300 [Mucilaginibacter sp. AW1-3]